MRSPTIRHSCALLSATPDTLGRVHAQNSSTARLLIEHFGGFDYDYFMHCACGRTSIVTARRVLGTIEHRRFCPPPALRSEHPFRPSAVTALRDSNDPALSNDAIRD